MIAKDLKSPLRIQNPSKLIIVSLIMGLMIQSCFSACDASCATCYASANTTCLSCSSPRYYLASNNSCGTSCPSGYFKNNTGQVCTQCQVSCATCNGSTGTNCLSCSSPRYYLATNNSCGTSCPSNYFKDANQVCTLCQSSCATCNGSTNTNCLSCASPNYYLATNNSCGTTCPTNYFKDAGQICTKCHTSCATCSDETSTSCLTCASPNYYLASNKSCSTVCPSGFFKNATGLVCTACHASCATCSSSTNRTCLTCSSPNYFWASNSSCGPTCPTGYYGDNNTRICTKCDATCGTCNGTTSTSCLTCSSPRYLLPTNNTCGLNCPTNFFKDSSQFCTQCDPTCATCSDSTPTSCLTCQSWQYFVSSNNSCVSWCPSTHFLDTNKICTKCDSSCGTCNGTSSTSCLSCSNPDSFLSPNRSCVSSCGFGYFSSSQVCYKCDDTCVTCNGSAGACTTCLPGQFLVISSKQCVAACPLNSYIVGTTCIDCAPNCATCAQSSNNCLTCVPGYSLDTTNNTCYSLCSKNYQWRNGACQYTGSCDISCASGQCLSGDFGQCINCRDPNATFSYGSCICPLGYTLSSTSGLCVVTPTNDIRLECTTFDATDPNCVLKQTLLPQAAKTNNSIAFSSTTWNAAMQQLDSLNQGTMGVPLANDSTRNLIIKVPGSFANQTQSNGSNVILISVARLPTAFNKQVTTQNITSTVATLIFVDATTQAILPVTGLKESINITFPMTDPSYQNYFRYVKSNRDKFPSQNYLYILSSIFKCRFWNTTANFWMSTGVTMVDMNETSITCATVHTTEFGIEFSDMGFDNLTDAPFYSEPDTSSWHAFVSTSYVDNIGVYVVFVVGVMYLFSSTGGFFADFLSARLKKKDQKQLLPWWFAHEGRQIMEKLATGDLTRVVYSLQATETKHDLVDIKDVEVNLQKVKESQPTSPATVMPPQSDGEQSALKPLKNKTGMTTTVVDFTGDYPTGPQLPHKSMAISEIHISTPSGPVSSCTLFKEYILMLHPLINLLFVSTPFFSPRPSRALMYFGTILVQLMFATLFFQPITDSVEDIDGGTMIWQGLVVWILSSVVMYIFTTLAMLRKHHITEILAADPNDAENRLKAFVVPNRVRSALMYTVGAIAITGSFLWIMVFCAVNGWSKSIQWLEVFTVTALFDQVIFEFGIVAILVWIWKSRSENRKRLIVMKYKKVMLVG